MNNNANVAEQIIAVLGGGAEVSQKIFKYIKGFLDAEEDSDVVDDMFEHFLSELVTEDLYLVLYIGALKYRDHARYGHFFKTVLFEINSRMVQEGTALQVSREN